MLPLCFPLQISTSHYPISSTYFVAIKNEEGENVLSFFFFFGGGVMKANSNSLADSFFCF